MAALTQDQLARYIAQRLEAGARPGALADKIARYLTAARRSSELGAIMRKVIKLRSQESGITEVTITSATPISDRQKKSIQSILGVQKMVTNEVVDPAVIGGVRVETADSEIDLTVKSQLKQLKRLVNKGARA